MREQEEEQPSQGDRSMSNWCPIGPLGLHTWNFECDQCLWCGPDQLALKPGHWMPLGNGLSAWSANDAGSTNKEGKST
jgi:hypothetical protein